GRLRFAPRSAPWQSGQYFHSRSTWAPHEGQVLPAGSTEILPTSAAVSIGAGAADPSSSARQRGQVSDPGKPSPASRKVLLQKRQVAPRGIARSPKWVRRSQGIPAPAGEFAAQSAPPTIPPPPMPRER